MAPAGRVCGTYTIFEGTSEIQPLIISRAISGRHIQSSSDGAVLSGPASGILGPMVRIELERIEALEMLGMTLAHLNDAEARADISPRAPLLMAIRDKLALALREES